MDVKELSNEVQLRVKHNPAENGKKEWYNKASDVGEILVE